MATSNTKYDWRTISTEYITTNISLAQLAEEHGISYGHICKVCAAEHWVNARKEYSNKLRAKTLSKTAAKQSGKLARLINASEKTLDEAMRAFEDPEQFNRYIITESVGGGATETTERTFAKIDTKALRDMTAVIKELTGLFREFYNIPTPAQAEAQRIAAGKFELDRRKAEAEETKGPQQIEIIGLPEEYKR